jgi:ELWxxDGT repeat protein
VGDLTGNAKPATIVMDGNKQVDPLFASRAYSNFSPMELCAVGSTVYFVGTDTYTGQELWKSDGTLEGTDLVKDIVPGGDSSGIEELTNLSGILLFFAKQDNTGYALWKSDGTLDGTVKVQSLGGSWPFLAPVTVSGALYFATDTGETKELWKTDGTADGTVKIREFDTFLGNLTDVNGTLYFYTLDQISPNHSMSLWKSDGTAGGTTAIFSDYYVGADVGGMANLNGKLIFSAGYSPSVNVNDGALWALADPLANPSMLHVFTDTGTSIPGEMIPVNGRVFFTAWDTTSTVLNTQVWQTDGVSVSLAGDPGYRPWDLIAVNNALFFKALYNAPNSTVHSGLYTTAGPDAVPVAEINPHLGYSYLSSQAAVNGTLFFTAENSTQGVGLWKTDGTQAGTVLVNEINPGGTPPDSLTNVDGKLFFSAYDDTHGFQLEKRRHTGRDLSGKLPASLRRCGTAPSAVCPEFHPFLRSGPFT